MEEQMLILEKKVSELVDWKERREKERLVYPLDHYSRVTLDKGLFVFTGRTFVSPAIGLAYFTTYAFEVFINDVKRKLIVTLPVLPFTVNAGTDVITNTNGQHNLNNGDRVGLTTTSLLPGGLNGTTTYYIINSTSDTFKVSTTLNGSPVDITNAGLGTQYWNKIP